MASWNEVCDFAGRLGGRRLGETGWLFELTVGEGRIQRVAVFYELMQPDLELLNIMSAFAKINEVDACKVLKEWGGLQVGSIGYSPLFGEDGNPIDGMLTISSTIPLATLDLSQSSWLMIYLNILAGAADTAEQRVSVQGSDTF